MKKDGWPSMALSFSAVKNDAKKASLVHKLAAPCQPLTSDANTPWRQARLSMFVRRDFLNRKYDSLKYELCSPSNVGCLMLGRKPLLLTISWQSKQ
jgi:hypothetical protein